MKHPILKVIFLLVLCQTPGHLLMASPQEDDSLVLRFAVLGDAEPKPNPVFPGLQAAVLDIERMIENGRMDFVVGVGDIAHKGSLLQYEAVTPILQQLSVPFYPIMGNEEHGDTVERFLQFASQWNKGALPFPVASYTIDAGVVGLIFASPDFGRDFNASGIDWILAQFGQFSDKPVLLIVHGAQVGVFPENAEKGITNPRFAEVVAQPNLAAVISGDLHMDLDRVHHSKQLGEVHYLHIPGLERTKIPDESTHTPMFRVFSVHTDGLVRVDTFEVGVAEPLDRHTYSFQLPGLP
jgi:3',5'-cyclic-AMP phosphodiesterase